MYGEGVLRAGGNVSIACSPRNSERQGLHKQTVSMLWPVESVCGKHRRFSHGLHQIKTKLWVKSGNKLGNFLGEESSQTAQPSKMLLTRTLQQSTPCPCQLYRP